MKIQAWHFASEDWKLRDGRPLPEPGKVLKHEGEIFMCSSGLHASVNPLDALQYAPGPVCCLVECGGEVIIAHDKLVCTEREILCAFDATDVLRLFAKQCALSVLHLWNPPQVVVDYLHSDGEELRSAALAAALGDISHAARAAAWAAARNAAWYAAWGDVEDAASCAALYATRCASWAEQADMLAEMLLGEVE